MLTRGYTKVTRHDGYVPPVLRNVWMRAPYGHAGQWPSLGACSRRRPSAGPARYAIASDLYDLDLVGFRATAALRAMLWTARGRGFSVLGHPFLADLGADARSVIEYLKTL